MDKFTVIYKEGNYILESRPELAEDAKEAASTYHNVIAVLPATLYDELPEGAMLGRVSF